jgi:uncharacterized DUF497 family protein
MFPGILPKRYRTSPNTRLVCASRHRPARSLALTVFDAAHSEDEERWFTLGQSSNGTLLAVAHTYRTTGPASAQARVFSARPATRREREQYQNTPR